MSIGENIKKMRMEKNITQSHLAECVGVTQSMLCQIERGTKIVTMPLGKQIANVLNCSIEDLYGE